MTEKVSLTEILETLKALQPVVQGDNKNVYADGVKPLDKANSSHLVWIKFEGDRADQLLGDCNAGLVICAKTYEPSSALQAKKLFIKVDNPKLAIALVIKHHFEEKLEPSIHPTAFIHPEATIGKNVFIGPFTYVGKCKIGDNAVIWGNCYIHNAVVMHENVEIHAGCVIGEIGSGYAKDEEGNYVKFPHIGGVVLERDVEVGALTYINRGALSDTIIRAGAKIGNAVCIGHNVEIGENSLVIANSVVAGSTKVGKNVWIAHSSTLRNGINIGDNAIIGMAAVVTKNVADNETVLGNPAEKMETFKEWIKIRKTLLNK